MRPEVSKAYCKDLDRRLLSCGVSDAPGGPKYKLYEGC